MKSKHDNLDVRHWETRPENGWANFEFNQPYSKGLSRLNEDILNKTNYDPAVLFQWGTMQAMAIIEILKTVEKNLGEEGQKIIFECLKNVGYGVGKQITEGTKIPKEMTNTEWFSFYATIINRIAYASLETPTIDADDSASFHIDWCPHQDHYQAFDCRVQRYFVQGMIDAAIEYMESQGRNDVWDVLFQTTIPSGSETCLFALEKGNPDKTRKWAEYTKTIEKKAIEISKRNINTDRKAKR